VQATKTLTLTNISHSTSVPTALWLPAGATLVLNGANTIASTYIGGSSSNGVYVYGESGGDLIIAGSGSLTAATSPDQENGVGIGIYGGGSLAINSGTVTAIGPDRGIYPSYIVPKGYRYWTNTTAGAVGAAGPFMSDGGEDAYTGSYPYVKITCAAAKNTRSFWDWLLYYVCFGWIWMRWN